MKGEAAIEAEHLELLAPNVTPQPIKLEQKGTDPDNRGSHLALVIGVLRQLGLGPLGDLGDSSCFRALYARASLVSLRHVYRPFHVWDIRRK
jgi:hypothetical protein